MDYLLIRCISIRKQTTVCHQLIKKPLVHKHNKIGNKCHTQDNTDTWGNPSV